MEKCRQKNYDRHAQRFYSHERLLSRNLCEAQPIKRQSDQWQFTWVLETLSEEQQLKAQKFCQRTSISKGSRWRNASNHQRRSKTRKKHIKNSRWVSESEKASENYNNRSKESCNSEWKTILTPKFTSEYLKFVTWSQVKPNQNQLISLQNQLHTQKQMDGFGEYLIYLSHLNIWKLTYILEMWKELLTKMEWPSGLRR